MQVVNKQLISGKKVLLRYDIDVALRLVFDPEAQTRRAPLAQGKPSGDGEMVVAEDFKLRAGLKTLKLCLKNASKVIVIGHVGRPFATAENEKEGLPQNLSAKPIYEWFKENVTAEIEFAKTLEEARNSNSKFILLENIRFFHGEVPGAEYHATCTSKTCDVDFAHKLAALGEVYINEAFSSNHKAASTIMVPALLPHAAGLHFVKEVETLLTVRNNPKKPFIGIMGGAKVKDKLPVIAVLAQSADAVLVGGKLIAEIKEQRPELPANVMVGKLNEDGFDISLDTTSAWSDLISKAAMIVWNGPLGKFEDPKYNQTQKVTEMILGSNAQIIIGGGDSVAALNQYGLLEKAQKKAFVSVGGDAMLKLLSHGTLLTIEALS